MCSRIITDSSFDALLGSLVHELLLELRGDDATGPPLVLGAVPSVFPAVDELLGLFKHSCKELIDLRHQIDKRLWNLKKEVASQDAKHRKTLGELKRDITEYGEFVRSFNTPSIDEKFGIMANVFIVAPESLASLFEGTPSIRKDALRFIQLRDDNKRAKIALMLNSIMSE